MTILNFENSACKSSFGLVNTPAFFKPTGLDASAAPIDIFQSEADLTAFKAELPEVALDNLLPPAKTSSAAMRSFMNLTAEQNLTKQDLANPGELNEIIWFSVRGAKEMPRIAHLPTFDLMTAGLISEEKEENEVGEMTGENSESEENSAQK